MARWQGEHWESGRDDRSWRERMGDRWRDERYGRGSHDEDRDRWSQPEEWRGSEGRHEGDYGRDWSRTREPQQRWGESGREGWRGESGYGREYGRGDYTSYGASGRDWRDERGYGNEDRWGGGRGGGWGRESGGMGRGMESGGIGSGSYRGYQAGGYPSATGFGYGDYDRERYGRDEHGRQYGRDYREYGGRDYGRDEDRGPLERLGDRFREGMRHLTGKGPKGFRRSDDRVRDDVCERIARSGLDAEDVEVKVESGEVTLSGTVRSREEKRHLEDVAEDVFGVDEVHNQVRVRRDEQRWTTGQTITSSAQMQGMQGQSGTSQGRTQGTSTQQGGTSTQTGATSSQTGARSH